MSLPLDPPRVPGCVLVTQQPVPLGRGEVDGALWVQQQPSWARSMTPGRVARWPGCRLILGASAISPGGEDGRGIGGRAPGSATRGDLAQVTSPLDFGSPPPPHEMTGGALCES